MVPFRAELVSEDNNGILSFDANNINDSFKFKAKIVNAAVNKDIEIAVPLMFLCNF